MAVLIALIPVNQDFSWDAHHGEDGHQYRGELLRSCGLEWPRIVGSRPVVHHHQDVAVASVCLF